MIGVRIMSIGECYSNFIYDLCLVHRLRFVDRDMLMRFHFGLGVGHTYSHYRTSQANSQDKYIAGFLDDVDTEDDEEVGSHSEDGEEDDAEDQQDEGSDSEATEQQFGSSRESLLSQFDEMYDSDLELDYEN